MNERPIPDAALEDNDAVEMLRVWIAKRQLHCSIKVGMYKEAGKVSEEKAWGIILADAARHISSALEASYAGPRGDILEKIRESFGNELNRPTSDLTGGFIKRH